MSHQDIVHETYHISPIAEWFHVFPHVDMAFKFVNSTFDPSNSAYLEALGIIIAIPGFWLILTLLAFLIFFLCRCCDSSFKRKRKITPLKWILGLFAILCCGALAVGLYGNETAHGGILEVEGSTRNITNVIGAVKNQSTKIELLLNDDVKQDLRKLEDLFKKERGINGTVRELLLNGVRNIEDNVTLGLDKVHDIDDKVNSVNFQIFPNIIDQVEMFRWPATIGVLGLLILLCFTLIWGVIKHSRCLLVLFSVFGLLSVVICWVLVSLYLGICVAGSDFCLEPEPFLYQQANGIIESGVVTYYIHCDIKIKDPFHKAIMESTTALKNIQATLAHITQITFYYIQDKQIEDTLNHLSEHINQTGKFLASITDTVSCGYVNANYRTALEATCTDTLEGTAFMLVSAVGSGLLFTVLIWVASHTWIHIRKKNGQSGSREDHAFLHGRYTPPPAPDADLTCATKF